MASDGRVDLALLFTPGITIPNWRNAGLLEREVRYYESLSQRLGRIAFAAGGPSDLPESTRLAVVSPSDLLAHPPRILKTNQLAGVRVAVLARTRGAKLVARGGYVPSEPWRHRSPLARRRILAIAREWMLCRFADVVIVTSKTAARHVETSYRPRRLEIVPNFVELDRFDLPRVPRPGLLTMIGRLTAEKNVLATIDAISSLPDVRLRLAGDGPFRARVVQRATRAGVDLELLGAVPHGAIPGLLADTDLFLIPSLFEGHPKALLEAMAAGVPCVAAPSPGIADLMQDGVSGYVAAGSDPASIRAAVSRALADPARDEIGRAAREQAKSFSLDVIVEREHNIYRSAGLL